MSTSRKTILIKSSNIFIFQKWLSYSRTSKYLLFKSDFLIQELLHIHFSKVTFLFKLSYKINWLGLLLSLFLLLEELQPGKLDVKKLGNIKSKQQLHDFIGQS